MARKQQSLQGRSNAVLILLFCAHSTVYMSGCCKSELKCCLCCMCDDIQAPAGAAAAPAASAASAVALQQAPAIERDTMTTQTPPAAGTAAPAAVLQQPLSTQQRIVKTEAPPMSMCVIRCEVGAAASLW